MIEKSKVFWHLNFAVAILTLAYKNGKLTQYWQAVARDINPVVIHSFILKLGKWNRKQKVVKQMTLTGWLTTNDVRMAVSEFIAMEL